MRTWFALAALLVSLSAVAKTKATAKKPDPRTVGLGHACKKRADCKGRGQTCVKLADAHGKETAKGFCALPCAALDTAPARPKPEPQRSARAPDGGTSAAVPDGGPQARPRGADAGTAAAAPTAKPATPAEIKEAAKRRTASRCPPKFQCRSAGAGVPIDLCMKE